MYAQVAVKRNIIPRNVAHRIVNRGVQKCTCAGASLRSKKCVPLNCINLDTATDPCMGSGHILAYLFDVLMQIYRSAGYTDRDAAASIVEHNLYGLDIDDRAAQMAYFVVMMKGCQYDSRFLRRHLDPHVYAIQESKGISTQDSRAMGDFLADNHHRDTLNYLLAAFANAKEYGSILQLEKRDYAGLLQAWQDTAAATVPNFTMAMWYSAVENLVPQLIRQAILLTQQYDVVVTNPPYMGSSGMNAKLSDYVKKFYPDSKSDLFAVFIERCAQMDKRGGYQAMITQHAWMFLSSFEKLREKLQRIDTVDMAHLGARGFDEIGGEVVQTTSFVMRSSHTKDYKGTYCRLIDGSSEKEKAEMFVSGKNRYVAEQDNFSKIPGSPVAYWVSNATLDSFLNLDSLRNKVDFCKGLATMDNNRFLRYWHEVDTNKSFYECEDAKKGILSQKKWFAYNKGGDYRRWYGNREYVINWYNDGKELKDNVVKCYKGGSYTKEVRNEVRYFQEGMTWSTLSSGKISMRYSPKGCIFDSKGSMGFAHKGIQLYDVIAYLNSNVVQHYLQILSPTIDYNITGLNGLPYKNVDKPQIRSIARECITISKFDWDSFETSWDFKRHPLV